MRSLSQVKSGKFRPTAVRLMDRVKEVLRFHHYAYSTEKAYATWILQYIRFNNKQHPEKMGKAEVERFLSHLAINRNVAVSTQNQALNALVFLYDQVLDQPIEGNIRARRSKKPKRLPVVMSQSEIKLLLSKMTGDSLLAIRLMYASGIRITELCRLRVHDIDFERNHLFVRAGKGGDDRKTLLPEILHAPIKEKIERVQKMHAEDLTQGFGAVFLPGALARKYPNAATAFGWQYVFPSRNLSTDPRTGQTRRHHIDQSAIQKAIRYHVRKHGFIKRITPHTLRHSFATHLLENGTNIRVVQKLLGHKDVKTTEIYTHVMDNRLDAVISPLELISEPD